MIQINFSKADIDQFKYERFHHPHPHIQRKMEVLFLKSLNLKHELICQIACISPNTMRYYYQDYLNGGVEKLKEINFYQPKSELENHSKTIKKYLKKNPPSTLKEAASKIKELTGLNRSLPQIRNYLLNLGIKLRKAGSVPGKLTEEKKTSGRFQSKRIRVKDRVSKGRKN